MSKRFLAILLSLVMLFSQKETGLSPAAWRREKAGK